MVELSDSEQAGAEVQITKAMERAGGDALLRGINWDAEVPDCPTVGPYTAMNIANAVFRAMLAARGAQ